MLTSAQVRSIQCSIGSGMSPKEIARCHRVSVQMVYNVKSGKVTLDQPWRVAHDRRLRVAQFRAKGWTYEAIAKVLGVSRQRVEQIMNANRCRDWQQNKARLAKNRSARKVDQ